MSLVMLYGILPLQRPPENSECPHVLRHYGGVMRKLLLAPLAIACTLRQQKNLTQSAPRLNHFFQRVCRHARQRSPAMCMGVIRPSACDMHAHGLHSSHHLHPVPG